MEMCRACLVTEIEMFPIDEYFTCNYNLLTNLNVKLRDGLPQYACKECLEVMKLFMSFRAKAISSETSLREMIKSITRYSDTLKIESNATGVEECLKTELKTEIRNEMDIKTDFIKEENISYDFLPEQCESDISLEFDNIDSSLSTGLTKKTSKKKNNNLCRKKSQANILCKNRNVIPSILSCGLCKTELQEDEIRSHLEKHKNSRKCEICFEDFTSWQTLFGHRAQHLSVKEIRCHICNKHFLKSYTLEYHYLTVHSGDSIKEINLKCQLCLKGYSNPMKLRKHIISVHPASKGTFICDYCSKGFSTKRNLLKHMIKHLNYKNFACHICEYSSNYKSNLKEHITRKHSTASVTCPNCEKLFKNREDHDKHSLTCTHAKHSICPICGKKINAAKSSGMNRHMRTHDPDASYKCNRCPKTYRSKEALKVHLSRHDGKPLYKCKYCPRKLYSASSRLKHHRIHTGEKPYVCHICTRAFAINSGLKVHMKVHGLHLVKHRNANPKNIDEHGKAD